MANLANGDVYALGRDLIGERDLGSLLPADAFVDRIRELTDDERRAHEALRRGEPIALVTPAVAQRLELGDRELNRRERRRRARRS
jgi:hypothetical protein